MGQQMRQNQPKTHSVKWFGMMCMEWRIAHASHNSSYFGWRGGCAVSVSHSEMVVLNWWHCCWLSSFSTEQARNVKQTKTTFTLFGAHEESINDGTEEMHAELAENKMGQNCVLVDVLLM